MYSEFKSSDMEIIYQQIMSINDIGFSDAIEIYKASFPSNERQPLDLVKERVEKGLSKLHVGYLGNEMVSIAFLWHFVDSEFVLLDYMAVAEKYRNMKIGGDFFKFLTHKAISDKKYLILEVEDSNYGDNMEQRKKRIQFYVRNGAFILKDVPYLLPSLDNTQPTEMLLMMAPSNKNKQVEKTEIELLITRLYRELYHKNEDNLLLHTILKTIPQPITLVNEF